MPGIDASRFVNIGQNAEDLTCGICLAIFVEPLVTQCCEQTYCNDCIKEWLKTSNTCPNDRSSLTVNALLKPPRFVLNMISKLKITCDFSGNGCEEVISYGRYKAHVKCCRYNPDALCADCGIKNGNRREHNCVRLLFASNQTLKVTNAESNTENKRLRNELDDKESDIKRYKLDINKLEQERTTLQQNIYDLAGRVAQSSLYTRNGVSVSQVVPIIKTLNSINNTHKFQFTVNTNDLTSHRIDRTINGFRWKITVTKENNNELELLGVYLVCESESNAKVWSCEVSVKLIIVQQMSNNTGFGKDFGSHTFTNAKNIWSFPKFRFSQFVNDKRFFFVTNDNILIEAQLNFIDLSNGSRRIANNSN